MEVPALVNNLRLVRSQITRPSVRLVAASKTKSADMVRALYTEGEQRHFGENYVQELVEKSRALHADCPEMRWHFIGHLQSNKVRSLLQTCNLYMVETVDRVKIARALDTELEKRVKREHESNQLLEGSIVGDRLRVMVQVNTSGEENKNGVSPGRDLIDLVRYVVEKCPHLQFVGLMTIGALARSVQTESSGANEDFELLVKCRQEVCQKVFSNDDVDAVELSMGMSSDYLTAVSQCCGFFFNDMYHPLTPELIQIEYGSTNVRVGSTIFGERE